MSKDIKIKIVSHGEECIDRMVLRDTTIGNVYDAVFIKEGTRCPDNIVASEDGYSFQDDVGDWVSIWCSDSTYELVEVTNNNEHWNTVDWSQIPEDVEAVVTFESMAPNYYKTIDGALKTRDARSTRFIDSVHNNTIELQKEYGDRLHLRPTPSIQPTPEPPESTQVESSQVETTSVPEFDWSTVEGDVEAIIFKGHSPCQLLKQGKNVLLYKWMGSSHWNESNFYNNIKEREARIPEFDGHGGVVKLIMRPPATPPLDKVGGEIQVEYVTLEKPSIQSILSDAQGLIKKHHNMTGEVKFTIKCS